MCICYAHFQKFMSNYDNLNFRNICLTMVLLQNGKIVLPTNTNNKYTAFPKGLMSGCSAFGNNDIKMFIDGKLGETRRINIETDYSKFMLETLAKIILDGKKRTSNQSGFHNVDVRTIEDCGTLGPHLFNYFMETVTVKETRTTPLFARSEHNSPSYELIGKYIRENEMHPFKRPIDGTEYIECVQFRYLILQPKFSHYDFPTSFTMMELIDLVEKHPDLCEEDLKFAVRAFEEKSQLKQIVDWIISKNQNKGSTSITQSGQTGNGDGRI